MISSPHVLYVDDELIISAMTKEYLEAKDFKVTLKHNAKDGLASFKSGAIDICVLDVKMPFKDGFELAHEIKAIDEQIPIIFLTGKTEKEYRIRGLTLGADDYITKPYSMEELTLRIRAILKRVSINEKKKPSHFQVGKYHFDAIARTLTINDHVINLSAIEAKLLLLFCENINQLVQRDVALHKIWGDDDYLKGRSLNVYVSKLRSLLIEDDQIQILNVHGEGYRMILKNHF